MPVTAKVSLKVWRLARDEKARSVTVGAKQGGTAPRYI